jgi:autotransporter-associated beta strand protein
MKIHFMKFKAIFALTVSVLLSIFSQSFAATYYWDNNVMTSGFGAAGGTWDGLGNSLWGDVAGTGSIVGTTTTTSDIINFGTSTAGLLSGTITVSGTVDAGNITFGSGSGAIVLSGGTINLAAAQTTTVNNATNTISSSLTGAGTSFTKAGSGVLILSGANSYTGTTIISGGTLTLNRATGSLASTTPLTFSGTGTFNMDNVGASGALTQSLGALTFSAGQGTVQITRSADFDQAITFASLAARSAGATGNFVNAGGTNSATNGFVFTTAPTAGALIDRGIFYNGSSYATYDAGGFIRAYGSGDTNYLAAPTGTTIGASTATSNVDLTTGNITAQTTISANTINMRNYNIAMSGTSQILSTNGLLSSGSTTATLGGGTTPQLRAGTAGGELVVRVNGDSDILTVSSAIVNNTSASRLTKSGNGKLILTGTNTYSGATTINAGTLQLGNGGAPGTLATTSTLTVNAGATLAFSNNSADFAFSQGTAFASAISGNGSVTMLGGNLTMTTGVNTYTGGFTLAGGKFFVGTNAAALGTGTFTISGGTFSSSSSGAAGQTLTTTNANIWSGNFSLDSRVTSGSMVWNNNGNVLLSGGSRTVTGATGPNLNLGGVVSDGGNNYGLTFTTMNSVTLSGANTYGGGTTMSAGTLNINNASALGTGKLTIGGAMTLNNSTANAITLSTNNLQDWNGDITFTGTRSLNMGTGAVTINGNRAVTVSANTLTVGGGIGQSGGARSLTKNGNGTLILTGTNTYTGGTTVNRGTLQVGDGTLAGTMTSTGALTLGGGTFAVRGPASGGSSQTVASLVTTAATDSIIRLTPGASGNTTLTITSNTPTTGAGSALNFDYSAGTTVGGTVGNNYVVWNPTLSGGIIGAGYTVRDSAGIGFATTSGGNVVRLTDSGSSGLPLSGGGATGSYFVGSGYSADSTTTPGSLVQALSGAVAASNVTVDTTGLASGANLALGTNLLNLGAGMAFNGANSYTITGSGAGGLRAAAAGATIFLNNGSTSTVTINAPIVNNTASALTVNGSGTTILGGANTYTGATILNGGTTRFSGSMGASAVTINNNAIVQIGAATGLNSGNSVTFGPSTTGSLQLLGNNVTIGALAGNALLGTPVVTNNNGGGPVSNATLTINTSTNVAFAGVLQDGTGGGTLSLVKSGSGTYTPTGVNTYTGTTSISGGQLNTTADSQLGNGGTLIFTGNMTWNMGTNVSLDYNRGVTVNGVVLTLNSGNAAKTVTGVLAGSGQIIGANSTGYYFTNTANTFTGIVNNGYQMRFASLGDSASAINLSGSNSEFQWSGGAKTFALRPFTLNLANSGAQGTYAGNLNNIGTGPITILQNLAFSGANGARTLRLNGVVGSGGNTFAGNITDYNGSSLVTIDKQGTSTWVLSGANSYTGGTTVTDGKLIMTTPSSLGNGALNIAANKTFVYSPTTAGALNIGSGVLTLGNGTTTRIGTALGGTASQSAITSSGAASLSGTGFVDIYGISGASPTAGVNNLITAASGLTGGTYSLGTVYNNSDFTVSGFTRAAGSISVTVTAATPITTAYWKGGLAGNTGVWAASTGLAAGQSNWQTVASAGSNQPLTPGAAADLIFSTATTPGTMVGMSLGANMTVKTLTVTNTATAFGLNNDGYKLTISPGSAADGITLNAGLAASPSIAANIELGASQTWTNNSGRTFTVSGIVSGANNLTTAGANIIALSGTNTYTGVTTVSQGRLQLLTTNSLYTGNTANWTAAKINVKSGATLGMNVDSAGIAGFTSASLSTLLDNISVANSSAEGLQAGAILGFDTSTATAGSFTQGNVIGDSTGANGGAIHVTKLGAGTLILDKTNTYSGATSITTGTLSLTGSLTGQCRHLLSARRQSLGRRHDC